MAVELCEAVCPEHGHRCAIIMESDDPQVQEIIDEYGQEHGQHLCQAEPAHFFESPSPTSSKPLTAIMARTVTQ